MSLGNSRPEDIVWLGEAAGHDVLRTGAKAAHLSRLAADHRVPPGFVLTAEAKRRAHDFCRLTATLRDSLAAAYTRLAGELGAAEVNVAVRSSAIDEDGPHASFAGQHDTYLNVSGLDAIAEAVEKCWTSTRSEATLAYRRQHELPTDDVSIAVLVQQLIKADASAVVFSANPVSGNRDEIVVTASWGLGESIVGGTVTPDSWVISRDTFDVVDRRIGSKDHMTVLGPEGTHEVRVPGILRRQLSLSDEQVLELAALAKTLEDRMGWPVDLECASMNGITYLLQCRPITAIGGAEPSASKTNTKT